MIKESYTGKYLNLFKEFLILADDTEAYLHKVMELLPREGIERILSIGGGSGTFELSILRSTPHARLWYIDPSPEQCKSFIENSKNEGLIDRIEGVVETTFQNYSTDLTFDRIISSFSWFYMGAEKIWMEKLLKLLSVGGVGIILMQDHDSIEAVFNRILCPDPQMSLTGVQIYQVLKEMSCPVELYKCTKWISKKDLFNNGNLTNLAKSFIAFIAQRSIDEILDAEWKQIHDAFQSKCANKGVPIITDILIIRK